MYPEIPTDDLVKIFHRSKASLVTKANKLNIKKILRKDGLKYFSEEEILEIIEFSKTKSISEIKKIMNRGYTDIQKILRKNDREAKLNSRWWTKEEECFLLENFYKESSEYICNYLNRKWRTICKKARELGMKRVNKNGEIHKTPKSLTMEERIFIIDNHKNMGSFEISKYLNRSPSVIDLYCEKENIKLLKLRKNPNNYSDKDLLDKLISLSCELGRCPVSDDIILDKSFPAIDIYYDRFGSFTIACEIAGLVPNHGCYGVVCYSLNGDRCYSAKEQIITNYFIENKIPYIKEYEYFKVIPSINTGIVMDWYIDNNTIVEYFGMQGFKDYEARTKLKQKLCYKYNKEIISLFPGDEKYLDKIFSKFINENPYRLRGILGN